MHGKPEWVEKADVGFGVASFESELAVLSHIIVRRSHVIYKQRFLGQQLR